MSRILFTLNKFIVSTICTILTYMFLWQTSRVTPTLTYLTFPHSLIFFCLLLFCWVLDVQVADLSHLMTMRPRFRGASSHSATALASVTCTSVFLFFVFFQERILILCISLFFGGQAVWLLRTIDTLFIKLDYQSRELTATSSEFTNLVLLRRLWSCLWWFSCMMEPSETATGHKATLPKLRTQPSFTFFRSSPFSTQDSTAPIFYLCFKIPHYYYFYFFVFLLPRVLIPY